MIRLLSTTLLALSAFTTPTLATDFKVLEWGDLIPNNEKAIFSKATVSHSGNTPAPQTIGAVREELGEQDVSIAGFVVPLEGDDKMVTEFLLVPYFGACVHVPPPPSNQIVYVKFPDGVPMVGLWDVVTVSGKLMTEAVNYDFVETAYWMEGVGVEPYEGEYDDPTGW